MTFVGQANRKWWLLGVMGTVVGVILFHETVVGVALPHIQADLAMSEVAADWVVNLYLLVFAGLAAARGKLREMTGSFQAVFDANAAMALIALVVAWLTIREDRQKLRASSAQAN